MQWLGSGVFKISKKKELRYGDVIPEGTIEKGRLAKFIKQGKVGKIPVASGPGEIDKLTIQVQELKDKCQNLEQENMELATNPQVQELTDKIGLLTQENDNLVEENNNLVSEKNQIWDLLPKKKQEEFSDGQSS